MSDFLADDSGSEQSSNECDDYEYVPYEDDESGPIFVQATPMNSTYIDGEGNSMFKYITNINFLYLHFRFSYSGMGWYWQK